MKFLRVLNFSFVKIHFLVIPEIAQNIIWNARVASVRTENLSKSFFTTKSMRNHLIEENEKKISAWSVFFTEKVSRVSPGGMRFLFAVLISAADESTWSSNVFLIGSYCFKKNQRNLASS